MSDLGLYGRNRIYASSEEISEGNVLEVLRNALPYHVENMMAEDYLYRYRKGEQPIIGRTKKIRSDIKNICVQNVASEIVAFKNGYFLTQPTYYVARKEKNAKKVAKLNDYLYASGKHSADNTVVDWFHTVGIGVMYVESNEGIVPCKAYALDPRNAFVVYSRRPGNVPLMGVNVVETERDGKIVSLFDVYTKNRVFRIEGTILSKISNVSTDAKTQATPLKIVSIEGNALGAIPIIEYAYDKNRMGSFETVLSLLDAINNVQSNRLDGVEQFIQSLMVLTNCSLPEDEDGNKMTSNDVRDQGIIELKSDGINAAKVDILSEQLDQSQTQLLVDDLLHQVCEISGMPFTSVTSGGTSDNVGAVYLRNGWQTADTFARNTEDLFKESNRLFDEIFLRILSAKQTGIDLDVFDIDTQFTRNEMDNLQSKVQSALGLKQLGLAPEIVLQRSGISNDPSGDVIRSEKYIKVAFAENKKDEVSNNVDETEQRSNRND